MGNMTRNFRVITVLRWIFFIPAAILSAWIAWLLVYYLNVVTMESQGVYSKSFLSRTFLEFISHFAMGGALVYVGAMVAPNNQKTIAYILVAVGLVLAGFLLFPAFIVKDYWAIWGGASLIFGLGAAAYSVSEDNLFK